EPVKEYEDKVKRTLQQVLKQYDQHIGEVNSIIQSGLQFWAAGERRKTEALRRELQERYRLDTRYWQERFDMQRQQLERELQQRLFYKGLVEAATAEQLQKELELAIQSGDHYRIFEANNNLQRFLIEEEFAEKKKNLDIEMSAEKEALDNEFARKKAELDYRAAIAEWKSAMAMGAVNTALGITKAFPIIPLMGLIAAAGAAQAAVMLRNRPVQAFSNGGIVGGNSFRGDNIITRQNSGEIDINRRQQKKLWDFIEGGSNGTKTIQVTSIIYLDSIQMAKKTFEVANNGHVFLKQRAVLK
ncbi:MAG: hypothetical protein FWE02_04455, partial [Defluviitaleaceae bacterium]|nr:hypothetical protein [Defluviitaleaceae bacterium]